MRFFRIRSAIKITIVLTLLPASICAFAAEQKAPGDKVAAVNGVTISQGDFDRELNYFTRRAAARGEQIPESRMPQMRNDVLENLIERELLYQESKKKGIQIKPEAVSSQLKSIKQRYPNEAEFTKMLSGLGMTESDVEGQIARGMAIRELIDREVAAKIEITDKESRSYYDTNPQLFQQPEQVKASHILIKVDSGATDAQKTAAQKKIAEVQQKVKEGGDFAVLAKAYSEGPSGPRGGDLGYFGRGQMVKPFEDAAFELNPNETSDIVTTRFGYHLIKVVDKKPAKKLAYAEVKEQLDARLKQQKLDSEASAYIKNLRQSAKIEKF